MLCNCNFFDAPAKIVKVRDMAWYVFAVSSIVRPEKAATLQYIWKTVEQNLEVF